MKAASYYARTEKGAAEVAQRSQAIPARARSLLLMIDGKSTGAQLIEKLAAFPNSGELLQLLETEGYIGPLDGAASGVAPPLAPARGGGGSGAWGCNAPLPLSPDDPGAEVPEHAEVCDVPTEGLPSRASARAEIRPPP